MKRTMTEPSTHMNAEDVAAALATVVLAISVALRGQGSRSAEDWLREIGGEIGRTVASLDVVPGEMPPGGQAMQHVLDMILASDPRRAVTAAEVRPAVPMPPSVAEIVCQIAKKRWPKQTAKHLAKHAGVHIRSAEYWLIEGAGISAESLVEMLRSDLGGELLPALMIDARPAWWISAQRANENARIKQRLDNLRAEIEQVRQELE